jgi:pimeloyl-ACP methyl ester carboxylesterase
VIPHPADVLSAGPPDAVCMPNAIANGITIDYATAGDGPPVLLICGTGQPADLWFAQVSDLAAAGHTVITFDNRGCGRSEAPSAPYSVPAWQPTQQP